MEEILEEIAQLIERGWTKQALARDENGQRCGVSREQAVCWCLSGAVLRVTRARNFVTEYSKVEDLIKKAILNEEGLEMSLPRWNDSYCSSAAQAAAIVRKAKNHA